MGGVVALANVIGAPCCDLVKLIEDGKLDEARELQHRLIAPNVAVSRPNCTAAYLQLYHGLVVVHFTNREFIGSMQTFAIFTVMMSIPSHQSNHNLFTLDNLIIYFSCDAKYIKKDIFIK